MAGTGLKFLERRVFKQLCRIDRPALQENLNSHSPPMLQIGSWDTKCAVQTSSETNEQI